MPLDTPVADRVTALNTRYRHHGATAVLEHALKDAEVGKIALVSSFGAESVVLLHLVSIMDRTCRSSSSTRKCSLPKRWPISLN